MKIPLPSIPKPGRGELTPHEYDFILTATLKPDHRNDPDIIAFIDSFVACKSIQQASEEVGIHRKVGYSLRHRKDIANCIQKLIDKSAVKYGFDQSEIFERVKETVEFDPIMVMNRDGSFKSNLYDIAPEARRVIKKLKVKNLYNQDKDLNGIKRNIIIGEVIEYEFYDKLKAAELVGREKDMFKNTTKVEHGLTKDMESVLLGSAKRAEERNKPKEIEGDVVDITPKEV